jgi:ketosteroid isomerase-like protein
LPGLWSAFPAEAASVRDTLATLSTDGGCPVAPEHDLPLEEYHRAGHAITNGNPEVYKRLYSRRDDVTLANPFGPPARGWSEVSATLDRAAENYRDGEVVGFENVSTGIGADLAYTVEVESYRARVGGAEEIAPVAVRVTTIFRLEEDAWKVVHRHADPITGSRPPESVIQA